MLVLSQATLTTVLACFFLLGFIMAEEHERYWSGPPQAIGIDLSPTLVHVVQVDNNGDFVSLASVQPGPNYPLFMTELFRRREAEGENHFAAWNQFQRWSMLRSIVIQIKSGVASSRWTSWLGPWLPEVMRNEDFRYTLKADLEDTDGVPAQSWASWTWSWLSRQPSSMVRDPTEPFPLTRSNFINTLAEALQTVKAEALKLHNISITSAVVTKSDWIYNELDRLVEAACLKADIEIFTLENRVESAMSVASHAEKTKILALEQSLNYFKLHRRTYADGGTKTSLSVARHDLGKTWIIARLIAEVLKHISLNDEQSASYDRNAWVRLFQEVSLARHLLKYEHRNDSGVDNDGRILIPEWLKDFTLDVPLFGADIARIEKEYIEAVQEAVEDLLVKRDELIEFKKRNGLDGYISDDDWQEQLARDREIVRTMAAPPEVGSWWEPIDALVVVADFPDSFLMMKGGSQGLYQNPGFVDGYVNWDYDVAAKGAALEAKTYLEGWEEDQRWARCAEDETQCDDMSEERDVDDDSETSVEHEEL